MTIELRVEGLTIIGWKSLTVATSIEDTPSTFSFEAIDVNLPTLNPPGPLLPLLPTKPCEVWVRGQRVLTGYVDGIEAEETPTSNRVSIFGRSKVMDVYDCSAALTETGKGKTTWADKPLAKIAAEIVEPYGVESLVLGDPGPKVPTFSVARGERAYDALERLCQPRGLLLTDDELGRLVITRLGRVLSETSIESGSNALRIRFRADASQLYSVYLARDQLAVPSDNPAQYIALQKQFVRDDTMDRFRPLEIVPPARVSGQRAKDLVTYEAAVRAGKSVMVEAEVSGWTKTEDGPLWRKNELVQVVSPFCGVWADLLVVSVSYDLSLDGGETTSFMIAPESGYELLTEPERAAKGKKRATSGIGAWQRLAAQQRRGAVDGMTAERPDSHDWWFEGTVDLRRQQQ